MVERWKGKGMDWKVVNFGKYKGKGKTLPQIVFDDPDWFFWACENNVFKNDGKLKGEADEMFKKATRIKIPQSGEQRLISEYFIHPPTGKFATMHLVPESQPPHTGSSPAFRRQVIDLSIPRQIAPYDKLGAGNLVSQVKGILFGQKGRLTKRNCEEFFDNDDNFDIPQEEKGPLKF